MWNYRGKYADEMMWVCRITAENMDVISAVVAASIYNLDTEYRANDVIFYIEDVSADSGITPNFYICKESPLLYNVIDSNGLTIDLYKDVFSFIGTRASPGMRQHSDTNENIGLLWNILGGRGRINRRDLALLILSLSNISTMRSIISICNPIMFYLPYDEDDLVFKKVVETGDWIVNWMMQNSGELGHGGIIFNENLSSICHLIYAGALCTESHLKVYDFLGWCFRHRRDILSIIYRHKFRKEILLVLRSKCSFAETAQFRAMCGCPVCKIASIPPYIPLTENTNQDKSRVVPSRYVEIEDYLP